MARRHNGRRVKIHRTYSIAEAAKVLGVSRLTISRWIKRGLPLIEHKRPFLILGADLRAFLASQQPRRLRCRPGEFFCVKCRAPRLPAGGEVEALQQGRSRQLLRAICPICDALMHRFSSDALTSRQQHLVDTNAPLAHVTFGASRS